MPLHRSPGTCRIVAKRRALTSQSGEFPRELCMTVVPPAPRLISPRTTSKTVYGFIINIRELVRFLSTTHTAKPVAPTWGCPCSGVRFSPVAVFVRPTWWRSVHYLMGLRKLTITDHKYHTVLINSLQCQAGNRSFFPVRVLLLNANVVCLASGEEKNLRAQAGFSIHQSHIMRGYPG